MISIRQKRGGSATVWLAISLTAVVGILALGMDGGRMMEERRRALAAADAAALAGAKQAYDQQKQDPSRVPAVTPIIQAATDSLNAAGYVNDGISATLAVRVGPATGQFKNDPNMLEVVIDSRVKATFGRIFTSSDPQVRRRAVAQFQRKRMGLVVLNPTASKALNVAGKATVQVINESVHVDSKNAQAVSVGKNSSLVADTLDVVGGVLGGLFGILGVGTVNAGAAPVPDPFADLPAPATASTNICSTSCLWCSSAITLQPGVYQGGIQITSSTVTMSPGVYMLDGGGLGMSGQANLVGNNVMIYNTGGGSSGPITLTGQGNVTLTPPTDGPYAGICIFQDRACTQTLQLGGKGNINLSGAIYAPAAKVSAKGNGTATGVQIGWVICDTLTAGGNGVIRIGQLFDPPVSYQVRLVE